MTALHSVLLREWQLLRRRGASWMQPIVLFAVIVTAFVLGSPPAAPWLAAAAPSLIWVALLLALIVGNERAFRDDARCGFLEQLLRAPEPLPLLMFARLMAQWLFVAVPLVGVAPLAMWSLNMRGDAMLVLWAALLIGSPALSLLTGLGAALTASLPRAGLLLPLCVLPLCMPVMIFGSGAARALEIGSGAAGPLYLLGSLSLLCMTAIPFATAVAVRAQPA